MSGNLLRWGWRAKLLGPSFVPESCLWLSPGVHRCAGVEDVYGASWPPQETSRYLRVLVNLNYGLHSSFVSIPSWAAFPCLFKACSQFVDIFLATSCTLLHSYRKPCKISWDSTNLCVLTGVSMIHLSVRFIGVVYWTCNICPF
jgi:hypothetical protein